MADFIAKQPDFKGEGIAIWKGETKDGELYLTVKKPEWAKSISVFKNKPKPKEEKIEEI